MNCSTGDVDCVASPFGAGCTDIVAWPLYEKMLAALPESMFNVQGAWPTVRKKAARSAQTWGEAD